MHYQNPQIAAVAELLKERISSSNEPQKVLRAPELRSLFDQLKSTPAETRASFGKELNQLKTELAAMLTAKADEATSLSSIDITSPFDVNTPPALRPHLLPAEQGSIHPLMSELSRILDIFYRMGFQAVESRQIDDDYHMFESLNFPPGHPARDDFDTFTTVEGLIAPAHTSTMQNRLLKAYKSKLDDGEAIRVVIPGRVFRNEDLDARHEHTFYQLEGVYVGEGVNVGHLLATLQTFLQEYYQQELAVKTQPYYFPFTEPSFEFALSCPFCKQKGCKVCSHTGWIELLGCGLIHPRVLEMANIDSKRYTGFAWGVGIDRLVMMKYDLDDIRHFESGKLNFLRQFT